MDECQSLCLYVIASLFYYPCCLPVGEAGDIVMSSSVCTSVRLYVWITTLLFSVYMITQKILERSTPILGALSGLLASTSLHFGSVTLLGVVYEF